MFARLQRYDIGLKKTSHPAFTYEFELHNIGYGWFIYPNHISVNIGKRQRTNVIDFWPGCLSEHIIYQKDPCESSRTKQ